MSLGTPLSLSSDVATAVTTTQAAFDVRAADIGKGVYSVAGLTLPAEDKLTISHETGKGGEERHLVRLDKTVVDTALVPATVSVYTVIVRPPNTAVTNAVILGMANQLVDFLIESANANLTKVLNSET